MRVFPVAAEGRPTFSDDFGAARSGGRSHEGNDIFAPEGTPVLAVDGGLVFFGTSSLGGNTARLQADDGATYLYTHLSDFEGEERRVQPGEVIGYVGHTGNAANTPPHVHFEMHPDGDPVNPFPFLISTRRQTAEGDPAPSPAPSPPPVTPPLARAAGRAARVPAELGLWFWFWGRLLSGSTSGDDSRGAGVLPLWGEP